MMRRRAGRCNLHCRGRTATIPRLGIVTLRLPNTTAVVALMSEGARQVLSADLDGYDAFFKQGYAAPSGYFTANVIGANACCCCRHFTLAAFAFIQVDGGLVL
jgi:hypothetical protein